jgi:formyl-CoA transferase
MADFGAEVIKIEHPRGDGVRSLGWEKDGVSLWWALVSRTKRAVTLNLAHERGQELLRELVGEADVLIENFRPGTLERWNLSPELLWSHNPGLVVARVSGFGQDGPYRERPGFGTLAESMSGFAHINGWPDGPPTLPAFGLGDGIAALTGAYSVMFALWWREHGGEGLGQVIDVSIYEPLFSLLGPQALVYDQLGIAQMRTGNRAPFTAPRNAYETRDGVWLGLSASAQSIAERVMKIVGRPEIIDEPWYSDHHGRLEHEDELDEIIGDWIAKRTATEVLEAFAESEGAIAPVYSIKEIFDDPHYQARETITTVMHPQLGPIRMQNVVPRMSRTPGRIDHPGPQIGEHNEEVYLGMLGMSESELGLLRKEGVI